MKIEINCSGQVLSLDDSQLDNSNYVDLVIDGKYEITTPIDELYSAVVAFKTLKDERKEM